METNYIELHTYIPFIREYLFVDFNDMSIMRDLLNYKNVSYFYVNFEVSNNIYNEYKIRDIIVPFNQGKKIEEVFDMLARKLRFKYTTYDEFIKATRERLEKY